MPQARPNCRGVPASSQAAIKAVILQSTATGFTTVQPKLITVLAETFSSARL